MIKHIKYLRLKPQAVLLIDGLGAVVTAILLMTIVRTLNEYFGMPQKALIALSIISLLFSVYSFSCFLFSGTSAKKLLKPIIAGNIIYCILTLGLVLYFYNWLSVFGITYFVGEVLIICGLVYIEIKTVKEEDPYRQQQVQKKRDL